MALQQYVNSLLENSITEKLSNRRTKKIYVNQIPGQEPGIILLGRCNSGNAGSAEAAVLDTITSKIYICAPAKREILI